MNEKTQQNAKRNQAAKTLPVHYKEYKVSANKKIKRKEPPNAGKVIGAILIG